MVNIDSPGKPDEAEWSQFVYVHDAHSWTDLAYFVVAGGLGRLIRIGAWRLQHSLARKDAEQRLKLDREETDRKDLERLRIQAAADAAVAEYEHEHKRGMDRKRFAEDSVDQENGNCPDSG